MESSETKPRVALFVLNRNGLNEDQIRDVMADVLDTQFGYSGVTVLWLSVFGKLPDRPHAMMTLSNDEAAKEMIGKVIKFTANGNECTFDIAEAAGLDAKDSEDPLAIFVSNIPVKQNQNVLRNQLSAFFSMIAKPTKVTFPKNWQETRTVLLIFDNVECARMVARLGFICTFEGVTLKCSYAKKR